MDCCGMPMAAWPGGGLVCRKCQAKVGVSWLRDRNPFARCVENPVVEDMAPEPEPSRGMVVAEDWASMEDVVVLEPKPAPMIFRGLDYGVGQGPPAAPAAPVPSAEKLPVEQPKQSGIGRLGRKGGPK